MYRRKKETEYIQGQVEVYTRRRKERRKEGE